MIILSHPDQQRHENSSLQNQFDVLAGQFIVSNESGTLLQATLGSCVAVCLYDPATKVGGMNHILLPKNRNAHHEGFLYGSSLIERLLNEAINLGAKKSSMRFKVFGGAKIIESPSDVGWLNIGFVFDFLQTEGYNIEAFNVGDVYPRLLKFSPSSGKVMMKQLEPEAHEAISNDKDEHIEKTSAVELF